MGLPRLEDRHDNLVSLYIVPGESYFQPRAHLARRVRIEADGSFLVGSLIPDSSYMVGLWSGFSPATTFAPRSHVSTIVAGQDSDLQIEYLGGATVTLQAVGDDGAPIEKFSVFTEVDSFLDHGRYDEEGPWAEFPDGHGGTWKEGIATLTHLVSPTPGVTYRMSIYAPGFEDERLSTIKLQNGAFVDLGVIQLRRSPRKTAAPSAPGLRSTVIVRVDSSQSVELMSTSAVNLNQSSSTPVEVVIAPPVTAPLRGRVIASGQGVEGLNLRFRCEFETQDEPEEWNGFSNQGYDDSNEQEVGDPTDASGKFLVRHLEPGAWKVEVRGAGLMYPHRQNVNVPATGGDVTIELPATVIRGRVIDENGAPIRRAWVRVAPAAEALPDLYENIERQFVELSQSNIEGLASSKAGPRTARTDDNGSFEIRDLPPGLNLRLQILHDDHAATDTAPRTLLQGETFDLGEIVLARASTITVTCGADGNASIQAAEIRSVLFIDSTRFGARQVMTAEGARFKRLPSGTYVIDVGSSLFENKEVTVAPGESVTVNFAD